MGPHGEGNRNSEGENLPDMCKRNYCAIGNNWFQKKKPQDNTLQLGWQFGTIIDYLY
jgi:hypothetical protein